MPSNQPRGRRSNETTLSGGETGAAAATEAPNPTSKRSSVIGPRTDGNCKQPGRRRRGGADRAAPGRDRGATLTHPTPPEPAAGHSYPSAMRRRRLTPSVVATIIVAIASTAASASRAPILRAFERPATKVDRVPRQLTSRMRVIDSRRVATYVAPRRRARRTTLFVATVAGKGWCLITIQFQPRSAAASCGPRLFGIGSFFRAGEGTFFAGIAANRVTRVVLVGSRGARHVAHLSRDNGFIYDCRAYNGCACLIDRVEVYAGGRLLESRAWSPASCARRH